MSGGGPIGHAAQSTKRGRCLVRDTVILVLADARERRALLDVLTDLGLRVRPFDVDDGGLLAACAEPACRLIVIDAAALLGATSSATPGAAPSDTPSTTPTAKDSPLARIRACSMVPVIAAAAHPEAFDVVRAMQAGASDFLELSSEPELLQARVSRLIEAQQRSASPVACAPIAARIVGESHAARLMRSRMQGLASLSAPVLVIGEAGTGRDIVARALHEAGDRAGGSFTRIDCAAWMPGAMLPKGGTLYLDHVDRLSPAGQQFFAHLLRELKREGWERGARIVASAGPGFAAGRDEPAAARSFDPALREELMRFPLELVPLRERLEDVPAIADQIVGRLGARMRREVRLTPDARSFLSRQGWPGNVQQLAKLLERAVGFCSNGVIDGPTMEQLLDDFEESLAAIRRKREVAERDELLATLSRTGGNISRCAEEMGRSRGAVYRLIEKYGIALPKAMRKRPPPLRDLDVESAG